MLKPKDIPILYLKDLHGLETENRLFRSYEQIEHSVLEDQDRIQVAMTRVDTLIANLLHRELKIFPGNTWDGVMRMLSQNFCSSHNLTKAWRELEGQKHHLDEEPRAFCEQNYMHVLSN